VWFGRLSDDTPRVSCAAMMLPRSLPRGLSCSGLLAASLLFLACQKQSGEPCERQEDCAVPLVCFDATGRCIERAAAESSCRESADCTQLGHCSLTEVGCGIAVDADCAKTELCKLDGRCTASGGACIATKDSDCQKSAKCSGNRRAMGHCTVVDGACTIGKDADCRATRACRESGRCTAVDGACVATRDEDCAAAVSCDLAQECSAHEGRCVTTEDTCSRHDRCHDMRKCALVRGACELEPGVRSCKDSAACKVHGRCDGEDFCNATSADDCKSSEGCRKEGKCNLLTHADGSGGECAADCAGTRMCASGGHCAALGKGCGVGSDADCQQSEFCRS